VRFDLRWKQALGLALEDRGFDATVLCHFRRKLLERGMERVVFNRLVTAAQVAGLLAKNADQVADSSHILGAAGVRDTYTLIRSGIRKLLRALGYTPTQHGALPARLAAYLDPDAPAKPDIAWADAAARLSYLRDLAGRASVGQRGSAGSGSPAGQDRGRRHPGRAGARRKATGAATHDAACGGGVPWPGGGGAGAAPTAGRGA
jgi:hypothetical protein